MKPESAAKIQRCNSFLRLCLRLLATTEASQPDWYVPIGDALVPISLWFGAIVAYMVLCGGDRLEISLPCGGFQQGVEMNGPTEKEQELQRELARINGKLNLQAKERRLLVCEIHDGLIQQLSAASHFLQSACLVRPRDPDRAWKTVDLAMDILHRGVDEARRLITGLQPPLLEEAGILAAVKHLIRECRETNGVDIEFQHSIQFDRLEPDFELAVFRTIQEALNNVVRHSGSKAARVSLTQHADRLAVEIEDGGAGFDPDQVPPGHYGLQGIRDRARLLGGKATVNSEPGKGTRILVALRI